MTTSRACVSVTVSAPHSIVSEDARTTLATLRARAPERRAQYGLTQSREDDAACGVRRARERAATVGRARLRAVTVGHSRAISGQ